ASSGIINSGRIARSAPTLAIPPELSFPSNTSKLLTRVSNNNPSVPSRRSLLITSAVSRLAPQQNKNAAPARPLNKDRLTVEAVPKFTGATNDGRQKINPTRPIPKRLQ